MKEFSALERKLNITFENKDLLVQAFIHRSYLNENPEVTLGNNERLEFWWRGFGAGSYLPLIWKISARTWRQVNQLARRSSEIQKWSRPPRQNLVLAIFYCYRRRITRGGEIPAIYSGQYFPKHIGSLYLDQGYDASRDLSQNIF